MSTAQVFGGRMRSYLEFVTAILYFFMVRAFAHRSADAWASEVWSPLIAQAMILFLLVTGYALFGYMLDGQQRPMGQQGLPARPGWKSEAGLGLAIGWAAAVLCVLPLTVVGGIAVVLRTDLSSWGWLIADAGYFALAAMAEEVAFRGYGFQRFVQSVGPVAASLGFAALYAIVQGLRPGASMISITVAVVFSLALSTAYLRTRALWVSWGLNFGWKASRALIFGLAVNGVNSHSSVVEGNPMGPFWITGGGYGMEGSWVALVVMLAAFFAVFRATRELDFRYNAPVIVPGGIPVDLDAASRRQHEAAMGPAEAASPALVQILPVAAPPASVESEKTSTEQPEKSQ
ncbi:MAG: CPBP family intramembrane metalloprotease [Acidobacteriota bacterium]|nr:CPBP family intramembrane metalloprotease [Acidobacteriota bacterium]